MNAVGMPLAPACIALSPIAFLRASPPALGAPVPSPPTATRAPVSLTDGPEADEAAALHRHVGANRGIAGAVEHVPVADDDVVDRYVAGLRGQCQCEEHDREARNGDATNRCEERHRG